MNDSRIFRPFLALAVMTTTAVLAVLTAPTAASAAPTPSSIVSIAERELGDNTRNYEYGGNDNCTYYSGQMTGWPLCGPSGWRGGGDAYQWCANFAKYVWREGGVTSYMSEIDAYAQSFKDYGIAHGTWHARGSYVPQPGDAVLFDWDRVADAHPMDHVGIVKSVSGSTLYTIEGNYGDRVSAVTRTSYATNVDIIGFTTAVGIAANPAAQSPAPTGRLGDFDGNGRPDIAAFDSTGNSLYISRNTSTSGNPSKGAGVLVSSGWATVQHLVVADWDGDGKADILGRSGDSLLVWRSTSTSTTWSFAPYVNLGPGNATVTKYLTSTPA